MLLPSVNLILFLNILADLAANQFSSHGLFICYKAINFHHKIKYFGWNHFIERVLSYDPLCYMKGREIKWLVVLTDSTDLLLDSVA